MKNIDLNKYKEFVGAVTSNESNNTEALATMLNKLDKESGVNIKASQVQTLIRLTRKVSRLKGKNALNPEARYNVLIVNCLLL